MILNRSSSTALLCLVSLVLSLCVVFDAPKANAQAPQLNTVSDQTQTPISGVGHNYQHLLGETVNFSNGSVNFKISFPVPKSRGMTLPLAWSYNSAAVNPLDSESGATPIWDYSINHIWPEKDGWNLSDGIPYATVQVWGVSQQNVQEVFPIQAPSTNGPIPCNFQSGMTFTDISGAGHSLGNVYAETTTVLNAGSDQGAETCGEEQFTTPPNGDGEVIGTLVPNTASAYLYSGNPTSGPFAVTDKNGTVYVFPQSFGTQNPGGNTPPSVIEDRNGNIIGPGPDSAGREGSSSGTPPTSITTDTLTYTATWDSVTPNYTLPTGPPGLMGQAGPGVFDCLKFPTTVTGTRNILTSLALPNSTTENPQEYQMFYGANLPPTGTVAGIAVSNPYGLVNTIVFPDGGWITYTWSLPSVPNEMQQFSGFTASPSPEGPPVFASSYGCAWEYPTPVLASRQVSFDGKTIAQTQTFTYTTNWGNYSGGWISKTTTVTTTDNITNPNITSKTVYTYLPSYAGPQQFASGMLPPAIPLESSIAYFDWGASTPTKTVAKTWRDQFNMTSEITTLNTTNQVYGTVYNYTNSVCPGPEAAPFVYLKEQDDYDFGNGALGPLKKKTLYQYNCMGLLNTTTYALYQGIHYNGPIYSPTYQAPPPPSGGGGLAQEFPGLALPPRVSNVAVVDGQTGAVMGQTVYGYDNYSSPMTPSGAIQHDSDYNTSWTTRGNITSVTRCNPVPQAIVASCAGPSTTYTYDDAGQPTSKTEPCSGSCGDLLPSGALQVTKYSFSDSYVEQSPNTPPGLSPNGQTDTYLTSITYPTPPSGVTLSKSFVYNWPMGTLASSTDENLKTTNYSYLLSSGNPEPLGRLTSIVGPVDPNNGNASATTEFFYNDGVYTGTLGTPNVVTKTWMNSGAPPKVAATYSDGMGHAIGTELQSDPYGIDYTSTIYDGMGNVYMQSNPYRTTDASYGTSTIRYDALGRKIQQTDADGVSIQQWCYDNAKSAPAQSNCHAQLGANGGTWVDFADENENDWQRTTDGLGRLVHVIEPNGASQTPSLETDYSYNVLDDLLCAVQKGTSGTPLKSCAAAPAAWKPRSFTYNGLSELISSTNPETGTIAYTYDLDGNVQTKTSARGITTNYFYDADNRLTAKTYTNDPTSTPVSCYQYDSSTVSGAAGNLIGRLTNQWSQRQSAPACNGAFSMSGAYLTLQSILNYDVLGHPIVEQQCTPSNCTKSFYTLNYTFDLAGDLTSLTNGSASNPIVFTNCFDTAGRLQTMTSSLTGATYPQSLFAAQSSSATTCPGSSTAVVSGSSPAPYTASGALQDFIYGNTAVTLNRSYDLRLRLMKEMDVSIAPPTPGSATAVITGSEQSH